MKPRDCAILCLGLRNSGALRSILCQYFRLQLHESSCSLGWVSILKHCTQRSKLRESVFHDYCCCFDPTTNISNLSSLVDRPMFSWRGGEPWSNPQLDGNLLISLGWLIGAHGFCHYMPAANLRINLGTCDLRFLLPRLGGLFSVWSW